jgi:hypothetical protein
MRRVTCVGLVNQLVREGGNASLCKTARRVIYEYLPESAYKYGTTLYKRITHGFIAAVL